MSEAPRPGSRKAAVHTKYFAEGEEAATALALDMKLAIGTVRSWINTWSKEQPGQVTKLSRTSRKMMTKSKVTVSYDPEREAYLIEQGKEVSEIKWADTGQNQYLTNKWIRCQCGKTLAEHDGCPLPIGQPCPKL